VQVTDMDASRTNADEHVVYSNLGFVDTPELQDAG